MLSLTEQQMELLASFMGHDLRVHRQYYQVPDTVLRVAKLSKLFIALEKGTLPSQEGKTLDDLSIDDVDSDDADQSSECDDDADVASPETQHQSSNPTNSNTYPSICTYKNVTFNFAAEWNRKNSIPVQPQASGREHGAAVTGNII
ncbi:uncharacterized protein LOC117299223 [Asterias rubens]|uniref:uncharacterized protein LOC117299223 n=1 Tax=Asterias rubens TaxID=7604 RepID=UPI00145538DB|nr:uncharacterized protein LOC117299223 [Asterias rubens]